MAREVDPNLLCAALAVQPDILELGRIGDDPCQALPYGTFIEMPAI